MRYGYSTNIKVFYQSGDLSSYLTQLEQSVVDSIRNEKEDYILNVNEEEYISYWENQLKVEPLNIQFDNAYANQKEEMIRAENYPRDFYVIGGKSYPRMVVYFHLPIEGNVDLIRYTPSTRLVWTQEMQLLDKELVFKKIQFRDDVEELNREFESVTRSLRTMQEYVNNDVLNFNNSLRRKIQNAFNTRKEEMLKRRNLLAGLKVPIKKSESVSNTFSIPSPKIRKKITVKPVVTDVGFKPEPSLDMETYKEILKIINGMGKEFERKPSVYSDKGEEQLRDHFLMLLEPNFEGSATGETFNKKGKTDILLRHENNNVFIAECKFWKGKGSYIKTIDQLLSYLTWRDSKAAVIMFVRNKEFSSVIDIVEKETPNHANYLGYVNKDDETWLNYRFHINGDPNREVKLAVMLYHIPIVE
ncbi:hypothetical protein ACFFJQ_14300 [Bacillus capparidis]|uniref:Restriction endonuclease type IV Mrr domain-containing protein n=1 Tax=Bacillus capparidis TaxID=1840411 RepID=A0ABS4CTC1_9BACI|nr:hypothetical protein [Bacillus capparidis]MBP1080776.1 hypothetical protein [Bacillus capparidis]MED1094628.1 hypothetical protein [Bacillus capparidis]